MSRGRSHRDGLLILDVSSYGQLGEVADRYRLGDPVAVHVESPELARRVADFMSGLGMFDQGDLRKVAGAWWLLRPPQRTLTTAEAQQLASAIGNAQGLEGP